MGCFVARTVIVLNSYSANAAIDNMETDGRGHIKKKSPLFTEQLGRSRYDSWPSLWTLIYTSGRTIFDFFYKELQVLTIDHISL